MKLWLPLVALFSQFLGCGFDAAPHAFELKLDNADSVIYGEYSVEELPKSQPYREALVSLFERGGVDSLKTGEFYQVRDKFGGFDLPWAEQASASYCSGILIGPDLALTAGHCLASPYSCENLQLVLNYNLSEKNDDYEVRDCREIVKTVVDIEGKGLDYAVIRLNKKVVVSLPEATNQKISVGENIYALGDPLGSFKKKASGEIRSLNPKNGVYVTTLDVFEGNSGSPVFSTNDNKLIGILSGGEVDFTDDGKVKRCAADDCVGEIVIPIAKILSDLKK